MRATRCPDGGDIKIELSNRTLGENDARDLEVGPGQYVCISVADNGSGMSPETISKAFDPFYTTKPTGLGTGLGPAMIYGFARQSGGGVGIASDLGKGSTVTIYLPRHDGEVADLPTPTAGDAMPRGDGQTVLVIDDEPTVRLLVCEILSDLGYQTIQAGDGAAGLRVLQSGARVDLLVTDVGLPGGMNGRQVADAARVSRPDLKVLFITGYAATAALGPDQLGPAMHVMTKPFPSDALAKRIGELLSTV